MKKADPPACPACMGVRFNRLFTMLDGREFFECNRCNLVSISQLPTTKELKAIYDDPSHFETQYFEVDDEKLKTRHFHHLNKAVRVAKAHTDKGAILEIGPGRGVFVKLCLREGLDIEAVEFSDVASRQIESLFGIPVKTGDILDLQIPKSSYNMVAAFDIIEHCPNPRKWLEEIHRILKPGGLLVLSTISIHNALDTIGRTLGRFGLTSPLERLYPVYHLHYFNTKNLPLMLNNTGFKVREVNQENYDHRKASSSIAMQSALKTIYAVHNVTGNKTNQYIVAAKHAKQDGI